MLMFCEDGKDNSNVTDTSTFSSPSDKISGERNPFTPEATKTIHGCKGNMLCNGKSSSILLVANWPKTAVMLPTNMISAHYTAHLHDLRPMAIQGDSVSMAQLYKEAGTEEQKLE